MVAGRGGGGGCGGWPAAAAGGGGQGIARRQLLGQSRAVVSLQPACAPGISMLSLPHACSSVLPRQAAYEIREAAERRHQQLREALAAAEARAAELEESNAALQRAVDAAQRAAGKAEKALGELQEEQRALQAALEQLQEAHVAAQRDHDRVVADSAVMLGDLQVGGHVQCGGTGGAPKARVRTVGMLALAAASARSAAAGSAKVKADGRPAALPPRRAGRRKRRGCRASWSASAPPTPPRRRS